MSLLGQEPTFNVQWTSRQVTFDEANDPPQSGPQDQKSVIFSHSVISLNQLLQNFNNTANIFLTFRNNVKLFLSQNIMHNF